MKGNGLLQCLQTEWKNRKFMVFTTEYSTAAKETSHNRDGLLTAEEHSRMSEMDFKDHFSDLKSLKQWYFLYLNNCMKIQALSIIGEAIRGGDCRNILAFGSGPSVLEFYLKDMFQDKIRVIVTDYDKFIMERVRILMPELTAMTFDFYADDPLRVIEENDIDTVIMFGAAPSMDDKTYVKFLRRIAGSQVKNIFTFEGGIYRSFKYYVYPLLRALKTVLIYLLKRGLYEERKKRIENQSSFHAYSRTRGKLKKIYRLAGWDYKRVKSDATWNYIYRLTRS